MALVCPAVLAKNSLEYDKQMHVVAEFAHRIQIDLTDGKFSNGAEMAIDKVWWPAGVKADIHLMYEQPIDSAKAILEHRPHMIIAHAEASGNFAELATMIKSYGVKTGLAILPGTMPEDIRPAISEVDHILIFSGDLGRFGGHADMSLLSKVQTLRSINPNLEIGWDGGINDQNSAELVMGGIDVLNVGGYIQNAEDPKHAYAILERIAEEAGTT